MKKFWSSSMTYDTSFILYSFLYVWVQKCFKLIHTHLNNRSLSPHLFSLALWWNWFVLWGETCSGAARKVSEWGERLSVSPASPTDRSPCSSCGWGNISWSSQSTSCRQQSYYHHINRILAGIWGRQKCTTWKFTFLTLSPPGSAAEDVSSGNM